MAFCLTECQRITAIKSLINFSRFSQGNERVNLLWHEPPPPHVPTLSTLSFIFSSMAELTACTYAEKIILFDWKANLKCQLFLCKYRYSFFFLSEVGKEGTKVWMCAYSQICKKKKKPSTQQYPLILDSSSIPLRKKSWHIKKARIKGQFYLHGHCAQRTSNWS